LNRRGWSNKSFVTKGSRRVTGRSFTKATLDSLLTNVLYRRQVRCNDEAVAGVHEAIVESELWDAHAAHLHHQASTALSLLHLLAPPQRGRSDLPQDPRVGREVREVGRRPGADHRPGRGLLAETAKSVASAMVVRTEWLTGERRCLVVCSTDAANDVPLRRSARDMADPHIEISMVTVVFSW